MTNSTAQTPVRNTSSFTLAKCIRDAQESQAVAARLDQARVDRILAEHDPFRSVA